MISFGDELQNKAKRLQQFSIPILSILLMGVILFLLFAIWGDFVVFVYSLGLNDTWIILVSGTCVGFSVPLIWLGFNRYLRNRYFSLLVKEFTNTIQSSEYILCDFSNLIFPFSKRYYIVGEIATIDNGLLIIARILEVENTRIDSNEKSNRSRTRTEIIIQTVGVKWKDSLILNQLKDWNADPYFESGKRYLEGSIFPRYRHLNSKSLEIKVMSDIHTLLKSCLQGNS